MLTARPIPPRGVPTSTRAPAGVGALGLVVSLSSLLGCGGGGAGAGTCGKVAPCGGDLLGSWTISDACATDTAFTSAVVAALGCPTATATSSAIQASGNYLFGADGTYTVTENVSATVALDVPSSCLVVAGVTVGCAELGGLLQVADTVRSAMCAQAGSGTCGCTLVTAPQFDESGTYAIAGTTLNTTASTGTATGTTSSGGYCVVDGSTLHLVQTAPSTTTGATAGQTIVTGDIVANRS
jgi:hypothetical protein